MAETDNQSGTPEEIAYRLFTVISEIEGKGITRAAADKADREWILSTYSDCLDAVRSGDKNYKSSEKRKPDWPPIQD